MEPWRLAVAGLVVMLIGGGCASSSRDVIARAGQPYPLRLQLLEPAPENTTLHLGLVDVSDLIGAVPRPDGTLSGLKIMPTSAREVSGLSDTAPVVPEGKSTVDVTFTPQTTASGKNYLITIGLGTGSEAKLAGVISLVVGPEKEGAAQETDSESTTPLRSQKTEGAPQPKATPGPKGGQTEVKVPIGKRPRVKVPIGGGKGPR